MLLAPRKAQSEYWRARLERFFRPHDLAQQPSGLNHDDRLPCEFAGCFGPPGAKVGLDPLNRIGGGCKR